MYFILLLLRSVKWLILSQWTENIYYELELKLLEGWKLWQVGISARLNVINRKFDTFTCVNVLLPCLQDSQIGRVLPFWSVEDLFWPPFVFPPHVRHQSFLLFVTLKRKELYTGIYKVKIIFLLTAVFPATRGLSRQEKNEGKESLRRAIHSYFEVPQTYWVFHFHWKITIDKLPAFEVFWLLAVSFRGSLHLGLITMCHVSTRREISVLRETARSLRGFN